MFAERFPARQRVGDILKGALNRLLIGGDQPLFLRFNLAQLRYAEAEKKGLIATYEKTIQSAFKDVADALARRETLSEQLDAQNKYVAAEQKSLNIAMKSYQAGVGDYLSVLTAQRTLWSAQATLISLQQTDLENRITLWQTLGGGAS
ncbi:TolC family protein [Klebsiella michiganensis]